MLLVVCPNLAIDRIVQVDTLQIGAVQRSGSVLVQAGGKGSNVARVFRQLGGAVTVIGFVGRRSSEFICNDLRRHDIIVEPIEAFVADSRVCTILCQTKSAAHPTVVNEESPQVSDGAVENFLEAFLRHLAESRAVVFTGSLPSGIPSSFYADLLKRVPPTTLTAVDASGTILGECEGYGADFVKPNIGEFSALTGVQTDDEVTIVQSARSKIGILARTIAITLGDRGALLVDEQSAWRGALPEVRRTNPIGCGDAFVAGYLKGALENSNDAPAALRWAMAAAASDAGTIAPGMIDTEDVLRLLPKVGIRNLGAG